ncbi:YihY/virulence factor BrkB family protein [Candidatus Saccharibacteria bacterium]|nr:MAG: YihY/virulence factor BrkB family protein [Candidatus Saccharibacteria bacterium]
MKKRNFFERRLDQFDRFQQHHHKVGFPFAVAKKYSDDDAGYQAALIAYYGFVSLFPLLIAATVTLQILAQDKPELQEKFLSGVTSYFPALGDSLAASINTPSKTGLALLLSLLVTFYGARGVAHAVQHVLNHVWAVPRIRRAGFPKSTIKSFGIIFYAGTGFLVAASLTGYAAATSHALLLRLLLGTLGFIALFAVFWGVFTFGSSARKRPIANVPGALVAAIGFLVLQTIGGYLVAHFLRTQTGLNAQFAVILAILFWLYLQAQVFLYAVGINTVRHYRLWPRSITPVPPNVADIKHTNCI